MIEIQHSTMTDAERVSREEFYQNLVWILDGSVFQDNFDIYHILPDPKSEIAQDLVWNKAKRHMNGANSGLFFGCLRRLKMIRLSPRLPYEAAGFMGYMILKKK
ncbi:hypothetical protein [Spongiibacter sp.]|uniref:hypothetical protein n=1 Tax=Spongiibacter sp. TaxID=2024860 RepID=UPI00257A2FC5|nr:hypothetical protein [Spongiibacter sp.]